MHKRIRFIIPFFVCLSVFICDCKKDSIISNYDKLTTIRAYLDEDDLIVAYEYLDSQGNIISSTFITYRENYLITKINDTIITQYILDEDNRIILVLDSSLEVIDTIFQAFYNDEGYLDYLDYFADPLGHISYHYHDSNSWYFMPSTSYSVYLSDYDNKIDFIGNPDDHYMNFIKLGRQNQKLVKEIEWSGTGGPSINPARSIYDYKFNKKGFVVEKTESYYPMHVGSLPEEDIEYYLTTIAYYPL